ncbi:hypothetical protein BSLG_001545 [Batrachochytrium salamandrivorans]|nr:hypothetical protein BSLG_001545 [Batrachochytrium salamandrivorans]
MTVAATAARTSAFDKDPRTAAATTEGLAKLKEARTYIVAQFATADLVYGLLVTEAVSFNIYPLHYPLATSKLPFCQTIQE